MRDLTLAPAGVGATADEPGQDTLTRPLVIGLIGSGRAASSLIHSLRPFGHGILIASRGARAASLAAGTETQVLDAAEILDRADITFLAVPDDRIGQLAEELAAAAPAGQGGVVVHLAGSVGREVLQPLADRGYSTAAMHPLQVLTGGAIPRGATFAVEADPGSQTLLSRVITDLGGVELELPASSRAAYHAAAVLAANLGMTLLAEAVDLMERAGVNRDRALQGLTALVRGGLDAAAETGLPAAITGPIMRGDTSTVARHLDVLASDPWLLDAYISVSRLALRQGARDGRPDAGQARAITDMLRDRDVPKEERT